MARRACSEDAEGGWGTGVGLQTARAQGRPWARNLPVNEDDPQRSLFPPGDPRMFDDIPVTAAIAIPRSELIYRASRSGGAGGQHVNTSSTRIELLWPFEHSMAIDDRQKELIRKRLSKRIGGDGQLRVVSDGRRSQLQNKVAADERLSALVREAM